VLASLLFAMKASLLIFALLSSVSLKKYRKKIQFEFQFSFWIFVYSVLVFNLMTLVVRLPFCFINLSVLTSSVGTQGFSLSSATLQAVCWLIQSTRL